MEQGSLSLIFPPCSAGVNWEKRSCWCKEKPFHLEDSTTTGRGGNCTNCAGSPWRFSRPIWEQPWAIWSEQILLGEGDWSRALLRSLPAWIILWLSRGDTLWNKWNSCVLFSPFKKSAKPKQQKTQPSYPHKNPPWKGRGMNRCIHPQNRMKSPFPLKGTSPSSCQPCKMRNKHRRALFATSEETLNRGFSLIPLTIAQAYPSLCMEGFFSCWFELLLYLFFYNNFDHLPFDLTRAPPGPFPGPR